MAGRMPSSRAVREARTLKQQIAVDETTLLTLEYPSVLAELAAFSMTPVGREKVLGLRPGRDIHSIEEAYAGYREVSEFVKTSGTLPLGGVGDIRGIISKTDPEGAYLLPPDLLSVLSNITSAQLVKSFFASRDAERQYPKTTARAGRISWQNELRDALTRILDEKGEIKDTASSALYNIRREIRGNKERARRILDSITTDKSTREYLQEDIITIRDDRYVLAVKAGMHTTFKGVVHGRSGSGSTFFIEPIELVELNNRVAILKREEKAEEIEILKEATRQVAAERGALLNDLEELSGLDLFQAKALFGTETGGVVPVIREKGDVKLLSARHPILVFKEKRGSSPAIPIDIRIPEDRTVLVISGANTGGKTVALKALGLLTLMGLSAIPIPAEEGSEVIAFKEILSDIGDRQDIVASLSTFSAHVKRMKEFLERASSGTLVLIDEAGAGTDPSEGGAFALAAIETLRERGARTVVTTHLNLLKAYAQANGAYLNASVEFDENTLKPLYRLLYGVPGPSLGLSIARSLGIPQEIIERAGGYIKEKEGAFIESIRALEREKEEIRGIKERLSALEAGRSEALSKLKKNREAIIEKAKKNIESVVRKADEDIREAIARFREERGRDSRKALSEVAKAKERARSKFERKAEDYLPSVGDKVTIEGSSSKGVIVAVDAGGKRAEVLVGNLKVWAPWDKLRKRGGEAGRPSKGISVSADMDLASKLNIIGLRVDEAMPKVERFIDSAHANGLGSVEIVHGMGTGRLGKAVEEYLKGNPLVGSFHHGTPVNGGVTVVELK